MANKLKDVNIPVATKNRSTFSLPENLYTTFKFGFVKPTYIRELVPGDTITLHPAAMIRCTALEEPSYQNVKLRTRFFFIPSRLVQQDFQDFIAGVKPVNGTGSIYIPTCMRFSNKDAVAALVPFSSTTDADTYDFYYNGAKYVLNNYGRRIVDILLSLGYDFTHYAQTTQMNALPLLAFIRTIIEWYTPSQYINSVRAGVENIYKSNGTLITQSTIAILFGFLAYNTCSAFEADYFNGSFHDANGNIDNLAFSDVLTQESQRIQISGQKSAYHAAGAEESYNTIKTIYAFQDWVIRKAKAGYRYFENLLAEWGVTPESARVDRTEYLGSSETPVKISDVTSTAQTEGANLGDYAGRGIGGGEGQVVQYESREHGYIIGLSSMYIDCPVLTGRDRHILHIDRLDFFTPEFEEVGVQALRADESLSGYDISGTTVVHRDGEICGYVPRYWEYKMSRDKCTGGFRFANQRLSLRPFVNGRWFDSFSKHLYNGDQQGRDVEPFVQDFAHSLLKVNDQYYNNNFMFQVTSEAVDPFIVHMMFDVTMSRPMASISESLPNSGNGSVDVPWSGVHM